MKKIIKISLSALFMTGVFILGRQSVQKGDLMIVEQDRSGQTDLQTERSAATASFDKKPYTREKELLPEEEAGQKSQQRIPVGKRFFDEAEAYRMVLAEHEYAIKSGVETYEYGEWENVEDIVFYMGKRYGILYYSLADLSSDGYPELLIGTYLESENRYLPYNIYHYSEAKGIIRSFISEGMTANIYEGGIIELCGPGQSCPLMYSRILPDDSGTLEDLGCYTVNDCENVKCFFKDQIEISEKEYQDTISRYTFALMELDWMPIMGFVN